MITTVDTLPPITCESVALVRIRCTFSAYGNYPNIAHFFKQENESGEIISIVSQLDSNVTVWSTAPDEELKAFILTLSPLSVFADEPCAKALGVNGEKLCAAVRESILGKSIHSFDTNALYEFFKDEFDIDRLPFIADVSHRLRHGAAVCVTENFGAAFMQQSGDLGYITGISVTKESRQKGRGSELIEKLVSCGDNKKIYVCFKKELLPFYLKNNFKEITPCVIGSI